MWVGGAVKGKEGKSKGILWTVEETGELKGKESRTDFDC